MIPIALPSLTNIDIMLLSVPVARPQIRSFCLGTTLSQKHLEFLTRAGLFESGEVTARPERQNYHKTISDICTPTVQLCAVHYYNFKATHVLLTSTEVQIKACMSC